MTLISVEYVGNGKMNVDLHPKLHHEPIIKKHLANVLRAIAENLDKGGPEETIKFKSKID